jgi:glycosyltransferase involved in cell wall biosynthesis
MTSKWIEAFGNVAIEAMATGVPVIAIDRIRCRRRVEEHFSTDAFAERVEAWLSAVVEATRAGHR